MKKIFVLISLAGSFYASAQLFNIKDRMDNLENFDNQKLSWGFFLNFGQNDYKIVLDPKYGSRGNKNLVSSKPTYSFGAGLMGKMRINDNFDLRLEPGLQFIERELKFDTQSNDQYAANDSFETRVLSKEDMEKRVKATTIDVPLLLEYHIDRWYNSRPYMAAGLNWMVNLQSNEKDEDDNQTASVFRSTTQNFGYSAEIGVQFYFDKFKLTPAFRGTFTINNELVKDNPGTPPYWASAINTAKGRSFMFILKFE
ncbi:type IX secretion/gliding motility protein PorT/SprT [Riemerella columbipharyngis]|uniref:Outer membrane protein beta-barrel domain-containing protein n=1 Tax=Riemerella columbipharyngis TaxID=1071918 RepID=A0A1G7DQD7_9FLAO|nr:porin family protein [Riemerella columbipharyngis]SDE53652.1 Outer membrane protein beta-barrel domain-containing protein [Riemerella columbipharyngis]